MYHEDHNSFRHGMPFPSHFYLKLGSPWMIQAELPMAILPLEVHVLESLDSQVNLLAPTANLLAESGREDRAHHCDDFHALRCRNQQPHHHAHRPIMVRLIVLLLVRLRDR